MTIKCGDIVEIESGDDFPCDLGWINDIINKVIVLLISEI